MLNRLFLTLLIAIIPLYSALAAEAPDDPYAVHPLLPGMQAPAFTVRRADGSAYRFDPAQLEKPVVIIFYRGGWCPYCNLHLAEMRHAEPELIKLGFEVIFISPDRPEILYPSLKEKVNHTLLSDSQMTAAQAFGVAFQLDDATVERYQGYGVDLAKASGETHRMLPVPAVFVVGKDGSIRFQYVNPDYEVRLHPQVLLAMAKVVAEER